MKYSYIKPITFEHWELYDNKGYIKSNVTFTENNTRVVDLNTNLYHKSRHRYYEYKISSRYGLMV